MTSNESQPNHVSSALRLAPIMADMYETFNKHKATLGDLILCSCTAITQAGSQDCANDPENMEVRIAVLAETALNTILSAGLNADESNAAHAAIDQALKDAVSRYAKEFSKHRTAAIAAKVLAMSLAQTKPDLSSN